jgi:hypothetical protein
MLCGFHRSLMISQASASTASLAASPRVDFGGRPNRSNLSIKPQTAISDI